MPLDPLRQTSLLRLRIPKKEQAKKCKKYLHDNLLPVQVQILEIIAKIRQRRYGPHLDARRNAPLVEPEDHIGIGIHAPVHPFDDKAVAFVGEQLARELWRT